MIRVAIVDDHPIARRGVEQILADAGNFDVTASVGSAAQLAEVIRDRAEPWPDVVILDLYHDGDQPCLAAIADLSGVTRVLVISASGRPVDVVGAIRAGAAGYVTKHAEAQMFVAAVETAGAGGFALSSQLADILASGLTSGGAAEAVPPADASTAPPHPANPNLSPREEEALGLIARGFTHAQTATRMGVSKATVDTYVERIRAKLQVGNKAELTRAALERLLE
jgi:DNA-binding NarL/FixJ family response regulator